MEPGFELLTQYGVLGIWVMYGIIRERWLLGKIDEISRRSAEERSKWQQERDQFITQCHAERENFIKEISLIRQEERDILIKELHKNFKKNQKNS